VITTASRSSLPSVLTSATQDSATTALTPRDRTTLAPTGERVTRGKADLRGKAA
jgi:hypothetical protein